MMELAWGRIPREASEVHAGSATGWLGPEPFDSKHFGLKMAKWGAAAGDLQEATALAAEVVSRAKSDGYQHVAVRIPSTLTGWIRSAEEVGFRFVDTQASFRYTKTNAVPVPEGLDIRLAQPDDLDVLKGLCTGLFDQSRFKADPDLSEEGATSLFQEWLENDFGDRGDTVWVACDELGPCGFLTCLRDGDHADLDLMAVHPRSQGKGMGLGLIGTAINHYVPLVSEIDVDTQGGNLPAMRIYNRLGLRLEGLVVTLHLSLKS